MTRVRIALDQIVFARTYSLRLIDSVPAVDWFRVPAGDVTHVAWQVGHLAMAQYRLCLERCRGVRPEDEALIPASFIKTFGRDSSAAVNPDPAKHPSPAEIRAVLDQVYAQVLVEVPTLAESELDEPVHSPHAFCKTKADCLFWASAHEMLHAGQVGLLRRLFGNKPLW